VRTRETEDLSGFLTTTAAQHADVTEVGFSVCELRK
jgi:hypothetical protein